MASGTVSPKHAVHIQDQAYSPVAQNGAPGDAGNVFECVPQALDHHFLLTEHAVHHEPEIPAPRLRDHQHAVGVAHLSQAAAESFRQPHHGQGPAPDESDLEPVLDRGYHAGLRTDHFLHREDRQDVAVVPDSHHEPVDDRQRERHLKQEARALPERGLDIHVATDPLHVFLDDVHADAAARNIRNLVGGRKPGLEDEVEDVVIGEAGVVCDNPALARLGKDFFSVDTAAVVANFDQDVAGLVRRPELDSGYRVLTRGGAFGCALNAVIRGVADHVHHRVRQFLDHVAVELGVVPEGLQLGLLAALPAQVADQPGHSAEQLPDWDHAHGHGRFLDFLGDAGELGQIAQKANAVGLFEIRVVPHQRLGNHELPYHVHQVVQPDRKS